MSHRPIVALISLTVLVCYSGFCQAQESPIDPGSNLIAPSFVLSSMGGELYEGEEGDRYNMFQVVGSGSRFVSRGFALGGKLLIERMWQGDVSMTSFAIGPSLAHFLGSPSEGATVKGTTYPYFGMSFLYSRGSVDYSGQADVTTSGFMISFGGGIAYMLSRDIGLSWEFAYEIADITAEADYPWGKEKHSASGDKINVAAGLIFFSY
jgi:hypothetical protein